MKELPSSDEVPLTVAALRLRESYHGTRTLMLRGQLRGRQLSSGRWYVRLADVERVQEERAAAAQRSA